MRLFEVWVSKGSILNGRVKSALVRGLSNLEEYSLTTELLNTQEMKPIVWQRAHDRLMIMGTVRTNRAKRSLSMEVGLGLGDQVSIVLRMNLLYGKVKTVFLSAQALRARI